MALLARTTTRLLAGVAALALAAALAPSVASASSSPTPRVAPTCAQGGRCIVGDVGPGGGKIIYVNREIRISNIAVNDADYAIVTSVSPHKLFPGDRIDITGAIPTGLNVSVTVSSLLSTTEFLVLTPSDLTGYTYSSGGKIAAAPGGWDYLQAAPQGWSGTPADPSSTVPKYANLASNLLDWRLGAGDANTKLLKRQTQNTDQDDPFDLLSTLAPEWYLPSEMEIWAMYKAFARNSTSAAAEGISPSLYLASSAGFFNDFGHGWFSANFANNLVDNDGVGLGVALGIDPIKFRPIRKLWLHTAQTNVAVAKNLGIGKRVQIPSVTKEGTPVSLRVLNGSVCTIVAPAKKNRNTFFTLTGGKKAGTCSLRITAPETYQYWALDQSKTITVK
ncbi:MAG: hypothetical protein NT180_00825 [Actinobacteria bacterium]|nr:hypothetical protein [Actinomycetota bacterium]